MATKQTKPEFSKGDKVQFYVGKGWVSATVEEYIPASEPGARGKENPAKVRMTTDKGGEVVRTVVSVRAAPKAEVPTKAKSRAAKA